MLSLFCWQCPVKYDTFDSLSLSIPTSHFVSHLFKLLES